MGHLLHHWYEFIGTAGISVSLWSWASYAAQEFPPPKNAYGQWALKIIQKALANQNKVDEIKDVTQRPRGI